MRANFSAEYFAFFTIFAQNPVACAELPHSCLPLDSSAFQPITPRFPSMQKRSPPHTFINSLTTNLTAFFREAHHFPVLAEHARRRTGEYRVWSAAASTGEEPYSLAITLADTLGMAPGRWKVYASDIDTEVLEKARNGVYRQDELKTLSPQQLQRYFMRGTGPHEGLVRVRQELANCVEFAPVNLLDKQYNVPGPFDAIFCRNVMIYFDKTTQQDILRRFVPLLKPDGLLFAGHSENFSNLVREFSLRGQTVYALSKEKA